MSSLSCVVRNVSPIVFRRSYGVSESANILSSKTVEINTHFAETVTFGKHLLTLEGLLKARQECSVDNWDGYQGKSINEESFNHAWNLALSLPLNIPIPDIYVDPEGDVTFEWYEGKRKVFSVSVGSKNELSYAGLYGVNKTYGVEYIFDDIPDKVLDNINRLYSE